MRPFIACLIDPRLQRVCPFGYVGLKNENLCVYIITACIHILVLAEVNVTYTSISQIESKFNNHLTILRDKVVV